MTTNSERRSQNPVMGPCVERPDTNSTVCRRASYAVLCARIGGPAVFQIGLNGPQRAGLLVYIHRRAFAFLRLAAAPGLSAGSEKHGSGISLNLDYRFFATPRRPRPDLIFKWNLNAERVNPPEKARAGGRGNSGRGVTLAMRGTHIGRQPSVQDDIEVLPYHCPD
ncbi:hypothetical protein SKAU_G00336950 [Synaphobranchus kaupii]|uniref:Uncharacterized protein n=1 Tax=Synaphobranchus kaupii TaxID=118154 RepID=A0A9Q1EM66_SYNKA|nr:hypothetical protein SKAU_G00336950 [Synaphobranchus kaupii]